MLILKTKFTDTLEITKMKALEIKYRMDLATGDLSLTHARLCGDRGGRRSCEDVPLTEGEMEQGFQSQPFLLLGLTRVVERICDEKLLYCKHGPIPTGATVGGETYCYLLESRWEDN